MTKDVLVSISGKHIDIMDDPARGYEVGEDGIENIIFSMMKFLKEWQARLKIRSRSRERTVLKL